MLLGHEERHSLLLHYEVSANDRIFIPRYHAHMFNPFTVKQSYTSSRGVVPAIGFSMEAEETINSPMQRIL